MGAATVSSSRVGFSLKTSRSPAFSLWIVVSYAEGRKGKSVLGVRASKHVEARSLPRGAEERRVSHVRDLKQRVVRSRHRLYPRLISFDPQQRRGERTIVVIPFLIGIPWYSARLRNRTVSSLPNVLATLFVTVFTTALPHQLPSPTLSASLTLNPQQRRVQDEIPSLIPRRLTHPHRTDRPTQHPLERTLLQIPLDGQPPPKLHRINLDPRRSRLLHLLRRFETLVVRSMHAAREEVEGR